MRSAILMGSVAMAALATPALAGPDRYDQGYSCTGQAAECIQQEMRLEDGNRFDNKSPEATAINSDEGAIGEAQTAASADDTDDDDNFGAAVDDAADEAGDEISDAANEVGDFLD